MHKRDREKAAEKRAQRWENWLTSADGKKLKWRIIYPLLLLVVVSFFAGLFVAGRNYWNPFSTTGEVSVQVEAPVVAPAEIAPSTPAFVDHLQKAETILERMQPKGEK
ncbi:MAG: hypothetical protein Q7S10_01905 [bacterium]|nr:hypothetical protein [bacterium]